METIGKRILKLRVDANLIQEDVGKSCGVSREAVSKWERGDTENLKLKNLTALCKKFSVTYDYLITGEEGDKEAKIYVENEKIVLSDLAPNNETVRNLLCFLNKLNDEQLDIASTLLSTIKLNSSKTQSTSAKESEVPKKINAKIITLSDWCHNSICKCKSN